MKSRALSFDEVIQVEVLRRAQAPLAAIAKDLNVGDVSGQYDFRAVFTEGRSEVVTGSTTLRLGCDGIVVVISPIVSTAHFDPNRMAVYAADAIQAAVLRAELWAWIRYASAQLNISAQHIVGNGTLLTKWYRSLRQTDSTSVERWLLNAHLAGLVTKFYHPQSAATIRSQILQELQQLSSRGIERANKVFELLTSPLNEIKSESELQQDHEFLGEVAARHTLQLMEDSYQFEAEFFISPETSVSKSHYELSRLLHNARLHKQAIKIVFAGKLAHIHSIYSLYMLLAYQLSDLKISNVRLDIGVSDTTFYIDSTQRYVKILKRWFDNARSEIHGLTHLIRAAANNEFENFESKRALGHVVPTVEELVLFYLRMLSPKWNNKFLNIVEKNRKRSLKNYLDLKNKMMGLIPKDWVTAIDECEEFTSFIRQRHAKFAGIVDALLPINLITDSQITRADIILATDQTSRAELIRRFPGGAANKVVFFREIDPKVFNLGDPSTHSPYRPQKFFFDAKWDPKKEKLITDVLLRYIIPMLKREVSINKIRAIQLVELKRASKEAIDAVKQFILHLQRRSLNRDDQALIDGLIFILAVKNDIDPHSDEWKYLLHRYRSHREELQDAVFEGKVRSLPNFSAIKFLEHFLGPKSYVSKEFPEIYQKHNDAMLDLLSRTLRTQVASSGQPPRVAVTTESDTGRDSDV